MTQTHALALAEARKLLRSFGAAPDARHRAAAIVAVLKPASDWTEDARREIESAESWLKTFPSVTTLESRLKALLARLA